MLALFQLGHDPGPLALLLEALEGGFNRLAIVEDDQRQINSLPFGHKLTPDRRRTADQAGR